MKGPTRIRAWFLLTTWAAINHTLPIFMIIRGPIQQPYPVMPISRCPSNILNGINPQPHGDTLRVDSVSQKTVASKITAPTIVIFWNLRFRLPSIQRVVNWAKELKNRFLRLSYEMPSKNLGLIDMIWRLWMKHPDQLQKAKLLVSAGSTMRRTSSNIEKMPMQNSTLKITLQPNTKVNHIIYSEINSWR